MANSYFILNDHQNTSRNLCGVLEEFPEFRCAGVTEDYEEGMNSILKLTPDIVFVNIDSKLDNNYSDIFSYCNEIDKYILKKPVYVALSNDTSKAYLALKNKFYDYIVTPGNELEIRKVVLQFVKGEQAFLENTLCLKSHKDYTLLPVDEILFLQADNNATDFVLQDGKKVSAFKTLKSFEIVLPDNFIRIHHSYIVNRDHISRINFGKLKCFLNHNQVGLPFSKSYRHNLQSLEELLEEKAIYFN
ncbi:LytTR family DNA-binding domain-containing protein [Christiangramia sp. SM2212]|uniref:LytTR family DNA-binding domain-containing protein n=1 Tax=Christiangramia sediminicola TaxID=3073267 RepID=A0ABU1ET03_9FLAO|nr:LytTR family DNA-binding domain-containing protein [Christiangramia sp. SM2212]MDR5591099.1 LytTR family DNA-binding domain-containing protein [Christiangramia sp. SM2212]